MTAIHIHLLVRVCLSAWLVCAIAGCTATRETYTGQSADAVWTAMIAAAESPDYTHDTDIAQRWTVRTNNVYVDDEQSRLEVFRTLERYLHQPGQPVLHENREWRFQIVMEQQDPPVVQFTSRGAAVPAHAWLEADRYFAQVWDMLGLTPPEPPKPKRPEITAEQREAVQMYDN